MLGTGQIRRLSRARSACAVALAGAVASATVAVAVADGGVAAAAVAAPIPIAGVRTIGIGADQLGSPRGLGLDGGGNLFVADTPNNRVVEFVRRSDGTYPKTGAVVAGNGGLGTGLDQLNSPTGVGLDGKGNLFVSDTLNNRVVEFTYSSSTGGYSASGAVVAGVGGQGTGPNQLNAPAGLAFDANGDLFVADASNNRVQEYTLDGSTGTYPGSGITVAGSGGRGSGSNQLRSPGSVALTAAGDLLTADTVNQRVVRSALDTTTNTYAANATVIATLPNLVNWIALDRSGTLLASYGYAGSGSVQRFAYDLASGAFASTGTDIGAPSVGPQGIVVDVAGHLFVANTETTQANLGWDLVLQLTYDPARGVYDPPGTVLPMVNGKANDGVSSVAVDSHGNLFVADQSVYEYFVDPLTKAISPKATMVTTTAGALALNSRDDLVVGTSNGVLLYPRSTAGGYPSTGSPVPGASQLAGQSATALAFDGRDNLFVATSTQVLEFRYNVTTGTYPATGVVVATAPVASTTMAPGVSGVALDRANNLFVSFGAADEVVEYLYRSATDTYAASGATVAGSGGTGTAANQLFEPFQIAVDGAGTLFVLDGGNARVMQYTGDPATGAYTAQGTTVFTGGQDNWPQRGGVAVDGAGDVLFGFSYRSALVYEAATTTPLPSPSPSPSSSPSPSVSSSPSPSASSSPSPSVSPSVSPSPSPTLTPTNLQPNPGFEGSGVPADYWGGRLARTTSVVHSGAYALAQTTNSSSGGWDLDANPSWYAPVSAGKSYTATIWVRSSAVVTVRLNVDLLDKNGNYIDSASATVVNLAANTWTKLTLGGIQPASGEVYAGMEPNFSRATTGTVVTWDDMSLTTP